MTSDPLLATYARVPLTFVRGQGSYLEDETNERYLDFACGIGVNALGHGHPAPLEALKNQADAVWHVSNLYRIPAQEELGRRLVEASFADRVFFCNSGAESLECAIKMARRYHHAQGAPERFRVLTFEGAFHGRTLATLAAGGQAKHLDGFGPKVDGFDQVPFGDYGALSDTIGAESAAVLMEPVQGEGGIRPFPDAFLEQVRALCDEHGLLLIFDEVQCGNGRTGKLFAYEHTKAVPDILCTAKGLGNGFPIGACLATQEVADTMTPGSHGSTFGGNPLACAVGAAVMDVLLEPGFLDGVARKGAYLVSELEGLAAQFPDVIDMVRGRGLMAGLKMRVPAGDMVEALRAQKLLSVGAGDNVVRLLPPLTVSEAEITEALDKIAAAARELSNRIE